VLDDHQIRLNDARIVNVRIYLEMCGRFGQAFSEFLDCVSEPKRIVSTSFLSSWLDLNRKVMEDIKQANTRLVNQVLVQLYAGSVQKIVDWA
jgi:hypothetical protein